MARCGDATAEKLLAAYFNKSRGFGPEAHRAIWPRSPDSRFPRCRKRASATSSRCARSSQRGSCARAPPTWCAGSAPPPRAIPVPRDAILPAFLPGGFPAAWWRGRAASARAGATQGCKRPHHRVPAQFLAGGLLGPRCIPRRPPGAALPGHSPSGSAAPHRSTPPPVPAQRQLLRIRRLRGAARGQAAAARRPHDCGHGHSCCGADEGEVRAGLRRPPPHPAAVHVPVHPRTRGHARARISRRSARGLRGEPPRRRLLPQPLVRGAGPEPRWSPARHRGRPLAARAPLRRGRERRRGGEAGGSPGHVSFLLRAPSPCPVPRGAAHAIPLHAPPQLHSPPSRGGSGRGCVAACSPAPPPPRACAESRLRCLCSPWIRRPCSPAPCPSKRLLCSRAPAPPAGSTRRVSWWCSRTAARALPATTAPPTPPSPPACCATWATSCSRRKRVTVRGPQESHDTHTHLHPHLSAWTPHPASWVAAAECDRPVLPPLEPPRGLSPPRALHWDDLPRELCAEARAAEAQLLDRGSNEDFAVICTPPEGAGGQCYPVVRALSTRPPSPAAPPHQCPRLLRVRQGAHQGGALQPGRVRAAGAAGRAAAGPGSLGADLRDRLLACLLPWAHRDLPRTYRRGQGVRGRDGQPQRDGETPLLPIPRSRLPADGPPCQRERKVRAFQEAIKSNRRAMQLAVSGRGAL